MNDEVAVAFEQHVWDTLSRIEVSDHVDHLPKTKKRPAVAYLPWHKAWMLTIRKFPATTYSHRPDLHHPDETVEVEVDVNISNGTDNRFINAKLAVMDQWFNAIPKPNARQVNDARQRCLVKALAFAGLGLNLWAGEVMTPVGELGDPIDDDQLARLEELLEESGADRDRFLKWCEVETLSDLPLERYRSALGLLEAKIRQKAKEANDG